MGRGGTDEAVANELQQPPGSPQTIAGARAIELALISGNKNIQFIEWVDHGYGIVDLNARRAIFEYWWQDKLTPDSPDVLGRQMIAYARDNAASAIPQFRDQLDDVVAHGLQVAPTSGARNAEPASLDSAAVIPR
jgi:alkaline phosphatase D